MNLFKFSRILENIRQATVNMIFDESKIPNIKKNSKFFKKHC